MPSRASDNGDGLLLGDFRFGDLLPRLLPATGCHIVMNSSKVLSARLSVAAAGAEETDDDSNFEELKKDVLIGVQDQITEAIEIGSFGFYMTDSPMRSRSLRKQLL